MKIYTKLNGASIYLKNEYLENISKYDYLYVLFADDQYINKYCQPTTDADLLIKGLYKITKTMMRSH